MEAKDKGKKKHKDQQPAKKLAPKGEGNDTSKWIWLALAGVFATTFFIYCKAISYGYVWDDELYILQNSDISDTGWRNIKLFFTSFYAGNYQPVTILTYAIEHKISGISSGLFHFDNILLHVINTYLVFWLARRLSPKNVVVALITAAFFAVHPMRVESVAWIAERKDVLYSFFFLIALILYTGYIKSQDVKQLVYVAILFVLSCLSKSAAVILPLVMLAVDYYLKRKFSMRVILEKVPFFAIALAFGVVAIISQKSSGAVQSVAQSKGFEHILIVAHSFISYWVKSVLPVHLSAIYPYPSEVGLWYYLSALVVTFLLFFVWYSRKWGGEVIFGFSFFVATIILVLQFLPVGAATMADRYSYIPCIGVFFIIAKGFEYLLERYSAYKLFLALPLVFVFIAFSAISYGRVEVWKSNETLFADVIEKYPDCGFAWSNRGIYYMTYYVSSVYANNPMKKQEYIKRAIADFENALKLPLSTEDKLKANYNMGTAKSDLGDYAGAVACFNEALKIDAKYLSAYNNRGSAKNMLHDYDGAIADFDKIIFANPENSIAHFNRGINEKAKGEYSAAIKDFDSALSLNPGFEAGYLNRGLAKESVKDFNGAVADFDKTLAINPNEVLAYQERGFSKFQINNLQGALDDYNKAIALNSQDANSIKNRGILLSLLGKQKR